MDTRLHGGGVTAEGLDVPPVHEWCKATTSSTSSPSTLAPSFLEMVQKLPPTSQMVVYLATRIEQPPLSLSPDQSRHLFLDNYFVKAAMFTVLLACRIYATGTVGGNIAKIGRGEKESDWTEGAWPDLLDLSSLSEGKRKKIPWGVEVKRRQPSPNSRVMQFAFRDVGNMLNIMSTRYHGNEPRILTSRKTRGKGDPIIKSLFGGHQRLLPYPQYLVAYNMDMNGVDIHDQLRAEMADHYRGRRGWLKKITWDFLLGITLTNTHIICKESGDLNRLNGTHAVAGGRAHGQKATRLSICSEIVRQFGLLGNPHVPSPMKPTMVKDGLIIDADNQVCIISVLLTAFTDMNVEQIHSFIRHGGTQARRCVACSHSFQMKAYGQERYSQARSRYECNVCRQTLCREGPCWQFFHLQQLVTTTRTVGKHGEMT